MATRTKQGFEDLGREHARNGDVRRYKPSDQSWQARAYNEGWQAGKSVPKMVTLTQAPRDPGKSVVAKQALQAGLARLPKAKTVDKVWFDELAKVPDQSPVPAPNTKGWPTGAAEHARLLAAQANHEADHVKRGRLIHALSRMKKRHGATP